MILVIAPLQALVSLPEEFKGYRVKRKIFNLELSSGKGQHVSPNMIRQKYPKPGISIGVQGDKNNSASISFFFKQNNQIKGVASGHLFYHEQHAKYQKDSPKKRLGEGSLESFIMVHPSDRDMDLDENKDVDPIVFGNCVKQTVSTESNEMMFYDFLIFNVDSELKVKNEINGYDFDLLYDSDDLELPEYDCFILGRSKKFDLNLEIE